MNEKSGHWGQLQYKQERKHFFKKRCDIQKQNKDEMKIEEKKENEEKAKKKEHK